MSLQLISRWIGPVSMAAAALIIVSQGVHLGLGLAFGDQSADSVAHTLKVRAGAGRHERDPYLGMVSPAQ